MNYKNDFTFSHDPVAFVLHTIHLFWFYEELFPYNYTELYQKLDLFHQS